MATRTVDVKVDFEQYSCTPDYDSWKAFEQSRRLSVRIRELVANFNMLISILFMSWLTQKMKGKFWHKGLALTLALTLTLTSQRMEGQEAPAPDSHLWVRGALPAPPIWVSQKLSSPFPQLGRPYILYISSRPVFLYFQ